MNRHRITSRVLALQLLLGLAGCAAPVGPETAGLPAEGATAEGAAAGLDPAPGGAADAAGLVTDTALGYAHRGHVERFPAGQELTTSNLRGHMDVYRFHVEAGQTFAVLLVREGGELDASLLVKDPDKYTVALTTQQAALPMAGLDDAVFVGMAQTSGDYFAFVSGRELESGGDYAVRFVALSEDPKAALHVTSPALRAYVAELRSLDGDLADLVARGGVIEQADGFVAETSREVFDGSLRDWARVRTLVSAVNDHRRSLFRSFLEASDLDPDDADSVARVGRVLFELWSAARAPVQS